MGGYGSGRWGSHSKKNTVEDCLTLTMKPLKAALEYMERTVKTLDHGRTRAGSLSWSRNGEPFAAVSFSVEDWDGGLAVRLKYSRGSGEDKRSVDYLVNVEDAPVHLGGRRWFFLCPVLVRGNPCGRRSAKLYLPPGGLYFGCRECYHLTYTSSQESHQFDGLFKTLAQSIGHGYTAKDVKASLEERETPRTLRMLDAALSGGRELERVANRMGRKK